MPTITYTRFIKFLQDEINLSQDSIAMAQKTVDQNLGLMPVVLWQYGLVDLDQLNKIYEWLETA
ncbi:DUF2949 domain-containing protein [Cyanobacterium sp. Dongsha4]|uniref:DUF2949 domain-containing protein n=1 Tax=Cyanobacterium sp. DS4 TaxID=2878255 RepID=UPI000F1C3D56|nr:DUF2949 domain-containing protein [Cyanobacterium sp. Dongsha4]RMD68023.1 MAG: DUF2949 domain-containing protein [Cyanobacteria bacterium J149]WVK99619.1 DUF2949 domain-containing protein [Cyanobacterium sp. Dongsha4]